MMNDVVEFSLSRGSFATDFIERDNEAGGSDADLVFEFLLFKNS